MIGCTTNRNGDFRTVSCGTSRSASHAGSSTHDGQIFLSELVPSSPSICSTSTSRDIVIANRRAFSAIELQSMIGTITMGSCKFSSFRLPGAEMSCFDSSIMAADREHQKDQRRHQQHHHPSAGPELDDSHDHYRNGGGGCPKPVYCHFGACATPLPFPPMRNHPALGQGERQKCTDCEQRNQPIGDAVEHDQQRSGEIARSQMPSE